MLKVEKGRMTMEERPNPVAEEDSRAEWISPAVEDFDVEALTLSGTGTGKDNVNYS